MPRFYLCLSVFICGCLLLPAQGRLWVANSEGDDMTVIDTHSLKAVSTMKVGKNPHGMTYHAGSRTLYVTIEHDHKLLKVDPWTPKILSAANVGITPNEPAVTKDGRFVYVPLRGEDALDIVDTRQMKAIKKIKLERWPHNAYTGSDGSMYVTAFMGGMIHVYNRPRTSSSTRSRFRARKSARWPSPAIRKSSIPRSRACRALWWWTRPSARRSGA